MNNYEKIKNMTIYQMARFLEEKVTLPFTIAIENKRSRINYVKKWLESE